MNSNRLSFFQFLFVHRISLLHTFGIAFFGIGIAGFVFDALNLFGDTDNEGMIDFFVNLGFFIVGSLAMPSLLAQYRRIADVLQNGSQVQGKITFSGQGYVTYEYSYHGQTYRSSDNIVRTRKARNLQVGQNVGLRFDPNDPKQAYIQDLYI